MLELRLDQLYGELGKLTAEQQLQFYLFSQKGVHPADTRPTMFLAQRCSEVLPAVKDLLAVGLEDNNDIGNIFFLLQMLEPGNDCCPRREPPGLISLLETHYEKYSGKYEKDTLYRILHELKHSSC
jgi:hypothetical protein